MLTTSIHGLDAKWNGIMEIDHEYNQGMSRSRCKTPILGNGKVMCYVLIKEPERRILQRRSILSIN